MIDDDGPEWFAPKRYGYGSGRPISWQGWALTLGFIAFVALASLLIRRSWVGYIGIVAALTVVFTLISAKTTRGGWRWRWRDQD